MAARASCPARYQAFTPTSRSWGVALIDDLPTYLREVVDATGAKRVIPMHWDDFTRGLDQPLLPFPLVVRLQKFFDQMRARPDLRVQTLDAFEPVELFKAD